MKDFERIQRREWQRQELLKELKKVILIEEDNSVNHSFHLRARVPENEAIILAEMFRKNFYQDLIINLINVTLSEPSHRIYLINKKYPDFLGKSVLPVIVSFTKVEAEREVLLTRLLEFALSELTRVFDNEMPRDQFLKDIGLANLEE